jgi:hypothetical protein
VAPPAAVPEPPPPAPAENPPPAAESPAAPTAESAAPTAPGEPAPSAEPGRGEVAAAAVAAATEPPPAEPDRGSLRAGARLGWHTTFGGISTLSPGVEAEWRLPRQERLSISVRLDYYGASTTIPPMPGIATALRASAQVVPIGAAVVWAHPYRSLALYAGAGGQAQLVHTALAGQERLDLVPAVLVLAGTGRRLGWGEVFAEVGWASGELDGELARFRTGGFQIAAGYRGSP